MYIFLQSKHKLSLPGIYILFNKHPSCVSWIFVKCFEPMKPLSLIIVGGEPQSLQLHLHSINNPLSLPFKNKIVRVVSQASLIVTVYKDLTWCRAEKHAFFYTNASSAAQSWLT